MLVGSRRNSTQRNSHDLSIDAAGELLSIVNSPLMVDVNSQFDYAYDRMGGWFHDHRGKRPPITMSNRTTHRRQSVGRANDLYQ